VKNDADCVARLLVTGESCLLSRSAPAYANFSATKLMPQLSALKTIGCA
jgi:hypothetical protein